MNKKMLFRIMMIALLALAAVILQLSEMNTAAISLMSAALLVLPLTAFRVLFGNLSPQDMTVKMLKEKFIVKLLWIGSLLVLFLLLLFKQLFPLYSASGMFAGTVLVIPLHIRKYFRQKKQLELGDVLWDERDMILAGKAALVTIQGGVLLIAIAILMIYIFPVDPVPSLVSMLSGIIIIFSLGYTLIYRWFRRNE